MKNRRQLSALKIYSQQNNKSLKKAFTEIQIIFSSKVEYFPKERC